MIKHPLGAVTSLQLRVRKCTCKVSAATEKAVVLFPSHSWKKMIVRKERFPFHSVARFKKKGKLLLVDISGYIYILELVFSSVLCTGFSFCCPYQLDVCRVLFSEGIFLCVYSI